MKRSSYRDRDYAFGQTMLTLRSAIGLTQTGLADYLGVSRRAVGNWEAGSSYPKPEHLRKFVALGIEHRAFPASRESEGARALWQAAHQKVLLDESWLATLLPYSPTVQPQRLGEKDGDAPHAPQVEWGDAPSIPNFYGREWELNLLAEWVVEERCRVVTVLGLGGIGKSALAVSLMHRVSEHFEVVIWRSLRDLPICEPLLDDLLQVLAPQAFSGSPASFERRLNVLLEQMRRTRVLLVLDNLESVLEEGEGAGRMRPGYEGFGRFLRRSAETEHQSCVLLTSREKPGDLLPLEGSRSPVRALRLGRLESDACEKLLAEKDVRGTAPERALLIEMYTGNPLALKIVAQTMVELFDGEIAAFLEQGEIIVGGVRQLLDEQFNRLSGLEQRVLLWLAILREPATVDGVLSVMVTAAPRAQLLEALEALRCRSLIERGQKQGSFTLQSQVLEYTTARLIAEASSEIEQGHLEHIIDCGLELAQVPE
jgi:transcriptional regulator with XRE-family HTH domain